MLPNFIVIGAAKAGTTSIYNYLNQHPDVYMSPVKEPKFFWLEQEHIDLSIERNKIVLDKYVDTLVEYEKLFEGVKNEKAVGEASTVYMTVPKVPERIKKYIPDAKIVAILRDPIERARSAHSWNVQIGIEPVYSFEKAVKDELSTSSWRDNLGPGLYFEHLKKYFETFQRDQIGIYIYDDLRDNPIGLMQDLYRFLGVDDTIVPTTYEKFNVSVIPKNKLINSFLTTPNMFKEGLKSILPVGVSQKLYDWMVMWNSGKPKQVSPELRKRLIEYYREDILKLQELIDRDLSAWLQS